MIDFCIHNLFDGEFNLGVTSGYVTAEEDPEDGPCNFVSFGLFFLTISFIIYR